MSCSRNEILNQARSWLGLNGRNGTHKPIIDLYNSNKPLPRGYAVKYNDYWCATFISALAIKCNAKDIIPLECSCVKMVSLFKDISRWVEDDRYTPTEGDIIFYDWGDTTGTNGDNQGSPDHVGIVESVNGTTITVIEGNNNNAVARRTIQVNGKYIRGYGIPCYDVQTKPSTTKKTNEEIAEEVRIGLWGNGEVRKTKLTEAGYDYEAIRAIVNNTTKRKTNIDIAVEVIQGKWGNGKERINRITEAGYDYETIRKLVNVMI